MKVGDLVKLPVDDHYWWSEKVGLVIGYGYGDGDDDPNNPNWNVLHIIVGDKYTRFGDNFVELVSESR